MYRCAAGVADPKPQAYAPTRHQEATNTPALTSVLADINLPHQLLLLAHLGCARNGEVAASAKKSPCPIFSCNRLVNPGLWMEDVIIEGCVVLDALSANG